MVREVRITIDDDELFERMKDRKQALDLSWEDVLHRGLRPPDVTPGDPGPRAEGGSGIAAAKEELKRAIRDLEGERRDPRRGYDDAQGRPEADERGFNPFDAASIERFVADTIRESTSFLDHGGWDEDLDRVTEGEDAVLRFPFLGDAASEPSNQIPIRVTLDVSGAGLDIDVVTIRRGKDVSGMNAFDPAIRQAVIEGIASGEQATLALATTAESYVVIPDIRWSTTDEGRPYADTVAIDGVVLDGD